MRDALRGRGASVEERGVSCKGGGGRKEERRIGGSMSWVDDGCRLALRFGGEDEGVVVPDEQFLCSCGRSVEAKLRAAGLRGGVVSPAVEGKMMVFLHFSQIPESEVIDRLHVLQIATVVEAAESKVCFVKPKSKCGLAPIEGDGHGILGDESGS